MKIRRPLAGRSTKPTGPVIEFWVVCLRPSPSLSFMKTKFSGNCLCGQVSYVVDASPAIVARCHCDECRKTSGTGHAIGAMFPKSDVTISGTTSQFKYMSGKGSEVTKAFCATCGSPIYGTNTSAPDHLTLTLGSMNDADGLNVQVVIFEKDKPHWDHLTDEAVVFQAQPDWTPER